MNAQHTQDQWEAVEYEHGGGVAFVRIGDITVSGTYRGGDSDELRIEDARLIAAAPEQHELLQTFTDWARQVAAREDVPRAIRNAAARLHDDGKRLIAKATGGAA